MFVFVYDCCLFLCSPCFYVSYGDVVVPNEIKYVFLHQRLQSYKSVLDSVVLLFRFFLFGYNNSDFFTWCYGTKSRSFRRWGITISIIFSTGWNQHKFLVHLPHHNQLQPYKLDFKIYDFEIRPFHWDRHRSSKVLEHKDIWFQSTKHKWKLPIETIQLGNKYHWNR